MGRKSEELANKTYELTDFIVNVLKVENVGATMKGKLLYRTSCHMTRSARRYRSTYQTIKTCKRDRIN